MTDRKNYIAGEWVSATATSADINPSNTDDVLGQFPQASAADAERAIAAARNAFPAWSRSSPQLRHDILKRVGDELLARKEEIGGILSREEGKPLAEGIGETVRAAQIFLFFSGEAVRLTGDKLASVRPGVDIEITREPMGVVGMICPWNFPIAIPAWKTAPALAYGNCVVLKPAELVPATATALAEIIARAGVPPGVFNLVIGRGSVVGRGDARASGVDAISFTGSVATGRRVAAACIAAEPMKKVQLEMGGKNPLVVLDDADLANAVEMRGQRRLFLDRPALHRVVAPDRHRGHPRPVRRGGGRAPEGAEDRRCAGAGDADRPGGRPEPARPGPALCRHRQGRRCQAGVRRRAAQARHAGLLHGAGAVRRCRPGMRIAREEIFGPVAGVIRAKDYDEALELANDTEFGLTAGICTTSLKHASHFKRNAEAGMVMVNLPTAGVDYHVPFGGRKGSSYGPREQGTYAKEFYTTVKTAYTFDLNGPYVPKTKAQRIGETRPVTASLQSVREGDGDVEKKSAVDLAGRNRRPRRCAAGALAGTAADYPNKPVTIIVPFAAGGNTDAFARMVGQGLDKRCTSASWSTTSRVPAAISAWASWRGPSPTATRWAWARSAPTRSTRRSTRSCRSTPTRLSRRSRCS